MAGKFEVKGGASGKFRFNLKASNGQVILTSQSYAEKRSALAGAESVRRRAAPSPLTPRNWNITRPILTG